jgi:hypothetical protein
MKDYGMIGTGTVFETFMDLKKLRIDLQIGILYLSSFYYLYDRKKGFIKTFSSKTYESIETFESNSFTKS